MTKPVKPARPSRSRPITISSSEAARYLGIHLSTIRRWSDAGKITYFLTPGNQRRYTKDHLDEFAASLEVKRTQFDS